MPKVNKKSITLPDLNRLYLIEKSETSCDPVEKEVLQALLEGYDSGKVTMTYDPYTGEMLYRAAELN